MSLFEDSNHFKIRLEFWNRSNSIVESKDGGGYDSRMLRSLPRYGGSIRDWVMQILSQYNIRNHDLTWESFDFLEAMEVYFQTISVDGSCLLHYHYTIEEGLCECVVYPTDEYLRNKMLFNYPGIDGESVAVSQKMIEQQLRDYANQYGTGSRTVLSTEFKREESLARREAYLADCKAEWLNDFLRYIDPFDDGVFAAITKKKFKYALESARPKGSAKITDRLDKMRGEQMWSVTPKTSFLIVDTEQIEAVIDYIEGKRLRSSGREEEAAKLKQPKILQAVKLKNDGAAIKIFAFSDVDAWVDGHPYIAPEENGPAKDFVIKKGVLTKYTGNGGDVVIPKGVTAIGEYAFGGCTGLTSVVIPDSVTSIGEGAFHGCNKLADEQGLIIVAGILFDYIGSEENVVIPEGVSVIGYRAFWCCDNLTSVIIPKGVISIEEGAFGWCKKLSGVVLPEGVTTIGSYAFFRCHHLSNINIPSSVTFIGENAFYWCYLLTSVVIPEGVTSIENGTFVDCSSLTNVVIPDSVTSIRTGAFAGCSSLNSITIPDSVTSIGNWAFSECCNLTNIVFPDSVTFVGDGAFYGCRKLADEQGFILFGGGLFGYIGGGSNVAIPDGVTFIGSEAFLGKLFLKNITIPEGVTSIGKRAFSVCSGLSGITIPGSVTAIEDEAFYGCKSLTQFRILNPECRLGKNVFGTQLPAGLYADVKYFYSVFTDGQLKQYLLKGKVWPKLLLELQVEIFLSHQDKILSPAYAKCVNNPDALGRGILARLSENVDQKACEAAANFVTTFAQVVPEDLLQQFAEVLKKSE